MSKLQAVLEKAELNIRPYSGRGMYGRECLAVTLEKGQGLGDLFSSVLRVLAENDVTTGDYLSQLADEFEDSREDAMGLGSVVYWPNIRFEETSSEDEEIDS